jgi:CelD/BcsL family acetyltransferase involved in cellulose biosynthesis
MRGEAVVGWFQDAANRAAAERLYAGCPWATAGQRAEFQRVWLEHYGGGRDPWLILARHTDGELAGLLPLTQRDDLLEYSGASDCEYRVWLARPETSDDFIQAALARVRRDAGRRIDLHNLPPETPMGWTRRLSTLRPYLQVAEDRRLVVPLADPARVARWVKERARLRTAWNKLARTGKVTFRRVRDVAEIDRVQARWGPMFDVRKGAAHGRTPFRDDPLRRPFTLALAAVPDLLHLTALERDGELLAAHTAIAGTRELSLMGMAHSEFEWKLSPGSLLIFELVQLAAREGFRILDMTPGTDPYKARFASDEEPVYSVTVHASLIQAGRRKGRAELRRAKHSAQAALAARAEARPQGWAARARPWLDRLGRRPPEPSPPPRLAPAREVVSLEGLPAARGESGWRHNSLDEMTRCPGPRESFLALARDLITAVRAGGELYTRTAGEDLAAALFLVPAAAVDGTGAPEDAQLLYVAFLDEKTAPAEQARAIVDLARALPKTPSLVASPRPTAVLAFIGAEVARAAGRGPSPLPLPAPRGEGEKSA